MFINHLNTKIEIYKHLPNDVINYYESTPYFMILYYQNLITVAHTNYYFTQTNNVTEHLEKRNGHSKSQVSCF